RAALEKIEVAVGVGVGDDESRFGDNSSRAWYNLVLEEARRRLLALFEKSGFDRYFPRFEKFLRRALGGNTPKKIAPTLPPPPSQQVTVVVPVRKSPGELEAERMRAEVRRAMMQAHQREAAGLRERVAEHRGQRDDGDDDDHS